MPPDSFRTDVVLAARELLGMNLVRGDRRARIVETEAYRAEDDPACHAYRRKTPRNATMWGEPGRAYVFLNYGMWWMLNVSAHEPGRAAAVLVRAARPLDGWEADLAGPGKLCRAFGIERSLEGTALFEASSELRIEPGVAVPEPLVGPRVGIAPGKGDEIPWRFADPAELPFVSPPRRWWV